MAVGTPILHSGSLRANGTAGWGLGKAGPTAGKGRAVVAAPNPVFSQFCSMWAAWRCDTASTRGSAQRLAGGWIDGDYDWPRARLPRRRGETRLPGQRCPRGAGARVQRGICGLGQRLFRAGSPAESGLRLSGLPDKPWRRPRGDARIAGPRRTRRRADAVSVYGFRGPCAARNGDGVWDAFRPVAIGLVFAPGRAGGG